MKPLPPSLLVEDAAMDVDLTRAHAHLCRIPVVVLTSSREDSGFRSAYDLKVNACIEKPVSFNKFMEVPAHIEVNWCVLSEYPHGYRRLVSHHDRSSHDENPHSR
jgi:DNA-binding NarL/FixJ family response regulator